MFFQKLLCFSICVPSAQSASICVRLSRTERLETHSRNRRCPLLLGGGCESSTRAANLLREGRAARTLSARSAAGRHHSLRRLSHALLSRLQGQHGSDLPSSQRRARRQPLG